MIQKTQIDDEVFLQVAIALNSGENWMVYPADSKHITKNDVEFFDNWLDASQTAYDSTTDRDTYRVTRISSPDGLEEQVQHGSNYLFNHKNVSIMNEENYEYLAKQIFKTGFGEEHKDKLKENMQSGAPEFSLFHSQDYGKDNTVATLHFRKPDESERYFFNRFTLLLKNEQHPEPIKQNFNQYYMQDNITLKEGYNQLSGRAVFREFTPKEGEKYKAWEVLDFKNVDKNGNFEPKKYYKLDLERELDKFAVKEMLTDPDKKYLMESLQRGNRQSATVLIAGEEKKVFIEAAPQFKSLNFYDSDMKRINTQSLSQAKEGETTKQEEKKDKKQEQKAGDGEEGAAGAQSESKGNRRRQGVH